MSIAESSSGDLCEPAEQVHELFRQLKLDDPDVVLYYKMLEELGKQQEPPSVWLRTNIHSVAPSFEPY